MNTDNDINNIVVCVRQKWRYKTVGNDYSISKVENNVAYHIDEFGEEKRFGKLDQYGKSSHWAGDGWVCLENPNAMINQE